MTTIISTRPLMPRATIGSMPAPGVGHNGGPPLQDHAELAWRRHCWKRAHKSAWKSPPREVLLRRLRRAREAGMSYHEYVLEIMERGRYL